MSVILEVWNSQVAKIEENVAAWRPKVLQESEYLQWPPWSTEDIRRSNWAKSKFDISSEAKTKYSRSFQEDRDPMTNGFLHENASGSHSDYTHRSPQYSDFEIPSSIKTVASRPEISHGYLGIRNYYYGLPGNPDALVLRDLRLQRDQPGIKLNPAERELVSAAWSAQLREKVRASEALSKSREVSVVMEYDAEDEPWRTW